MSAELAEATPDTPPQDEVAGGAAPAEAAPQEPPAGAAAGAVEAAPAKAERAAAKEFRFDDMNLVVGSRLQIELQRGGAAARYFTPLIGYLRGESMLIRTPIVNHVSLPLLQGERMVVRFFSGTRAYAFETWVDRVFGSPLYYMHVSFPKKIIGAEVRKTVRVGVELPAQLKGGEDANATPGRILDISAQGALVECARELGKPEGRLSIDFGFRIGEENRDASLELTGIIKNVRHKAGTAAPAAYLHGVNFEKVGPNELLLLQTLIWQVQSQNPGKIV